MRASQITLGRGWLALMGLWVAGFTWNQFELRGLRRELASIRLEFASSASSQSPEPGSVLENTSSLQPELLWVREELTALSRRMEGLAREQDPRSGLWIPASIDPWAPQVPGSVPWASPPAKAAETLRQQLGDTPMNYVGVKPVGDRCVYNVDTRLTDGRGIVLVVDGEGQIVTRILETRWELLPPKGQELAASMVGEVPIREVAEILEEGRTVFRVMAEGENKTVRITVSGDGEFVESEESSQTIEP